MAETLRILVVDDEPGMRLGVSRALRNFSAHLPDVETDAEFEVDQAESGEEALEKIRAAPPDVLLLDHKLPGMSGLDVLEQIQADPAEMLTIMITAYASLDTAITATKRGAYDFLPKPFTPEELKNAVRKAAGRLILTRQARQLEQEKRQVRFQFLSVLAHELKAPLAAIDGYLQIMKEGLGDGDPAQQQHMVERCLIRLDGMRKLIFDLLDLTRIESGQKTRELGEVDVVEIARRSIETVQPMADQRGVAIELHADETLPMLGDAGELEIILNNLVSNAVKYNVDDGRVDVTVRADEQTVTLDVADTGIGMAPEDVERLFGEFVRIKNAKTRAITGSGLGLSILKRLSNLYDGDIHVASEVDKGSTFTVTLKRWHESPAHDREEATPSESPPG